MVEALVRPLEREIGHQPDHADAEDAEDHLPGVEQSLAVHDHVPDPRRRADQLRDDYVRPRPAEHEPQAFGDLRRGSREHHAPHDAARLGAQRIRGFDQVAPRRADDDGDHQDDLENRPDEDDEQLLRLADPGPEDQQRNERGRREIARERNKRLEERFHRLERAHCDAERHGDDRGEDEAADHAPDRHADVLDEVELGEQFPADPQRVERILQEHAVDQPAERGQRPRREEQHEKRGAEDNLGAARDRLQRLQQMSTGTAGRSFPRPWAPSGSRD
jgi:hypothetical protein